jgi:uncharacterized protein (TIGR03435 family)
MIPALHLLRNIVLCSAAATTLLAQRPAANPKPSATPYAHIAPTTLPEGSTSIEITSNRWTARGYDLKSLIAQIFDVDIRRIDLTSTPSETARYDITIPLPEDDVDEDATKRRLQKTIETEFKLTITPESRPMDVYIITAPNGRGRALHPHPASSTTELTPEDAETFTFDQRTCPGVGSRGLTASAGTISAFGHALELDLDRLLIDESNLPGAYDFKIGEYQGKDELFQRLHDELGLVIIAAHRNITVFAARPAPHNTQVGQL